MWLQRSFTKIQVLILILIQMSKSEVMLARKNSLRQHKKETMRWTRLKRDPFLFWVTLSLLLCNCIKSNNTKCVKMMFIISMGVFMITAEFFKVQFLGEVIHSRMSLGHNLFLVSTIFRISIWDYPQRSLR